MTTTRQLPVTNSMNEYFWRSGASGRLQILRCADCKTWIHPYAGMCPKCRSLEISPQRVSGRATVIAFTVNHHP